MQITLRRHKTPWQRMRGFMMRKTPHQRAKRTIIDAAPFAGAAAAGAAAAFLLDPVSGNKRRTQARSMAAGRVRDVGRVAARISRGARVRAYGTTQRLRHLRQVPKDYDDATLAQKVRSEVLGRPGMHADRVIVDAHDGIVVLRGQVKHSQDIKRLSRVIRKLPGVEGVETFLHLPDTPAPNKQPAMR